MTNAAKILFHITGYHRSYQFEWLYRAIYNERDVFVIHVDRNSPSYIHEEFKRIAGSQPNVFFLPSLPVIWGGCGLIDAEWMAIEHSLKSDPSWTHIVNLSAQDYPLVPIKTLREELQKSGSKNFVLCNNIRRVHWRIRKRPLFRYIEWNKQRRFTPIPKIKPKELKINWVGPWWHILTREFCSWLISDEKALLYMNFLRSAGMPDELLIQNVILDSPFRSDVISCCKHEILWRRPGESRSESARPKVFTYQDLSSLMNSKSFFARKFDAEVDQDILLAISSRNNFDTPSLI